MDGGAGLSRCRLCDGHGRIPLIDIICDKIANCFGFEVRLNDGLPDLICYKCKVVVDNLNEVIMGYQLKQKEIKNRFLKATESIHRTYPAKKTLPMQSPPKTIPTSPQLQSTPTLTPPQISQTSPLLPLFQIQLMSQSTPPPFPGTSPTQLQTIIHKALSPIPQIQSVPQMSLPNTSSPQLIPQTSPSPTSSSEPPQQFQIQLLPQIQSQIAPSLNADITLHNIATTSEFKLDDPIDPSQTITPPVSSIPLHDQPTENILIEQDKIKRDACKAQPYAAKIQFKCLICSTLHPSEEKLLMHAKRHENLINLAKVKTKPCYVNMSGGPNLVGKDNVDFKIRSRWVQIHKRRIFDYDVTSPHSIFSYKAKTRIDENRRYQQKDSGKRKTQEIQTFTYEDTQSENPSIIDLSKSARPKIQISTSEIINIVTKYLNQNEAEESMFSEWRPKKCTNALFQKVIKKNSIRVSWTPVESGIKLPLWCSKQKKLDVPLDVLSASLVNNRKSSDSSSNSDASLQPKNGPSLNIANHTSQHKVYYKKPNARIDTSVSDNDVHLLDCEIVPNIPTTVSEFSSPSDESLMQPTSKRKNILSNLLNPPIKKVCRNEEELLPKIVSTVSLKQVENQPPMKPLIKCKPTQELLANNSLMTNPNPTPYVIHQNGNLTNSHMFIYPIMNEPTQASISLLQNVSPMNQHHMVMPSNCIPVPITNTEMIDNEKLGELYLLKKKLFVNKINFQFLNDKQIVNYPLRKIVKFKIFICEDYSTLRKNSIFTVTLSMDRIATFFLEVCNEDNQREDLSIWPDNYHEQLIKAFRQESVLESFEKLIKYMEISPMRSKVMTFLYLIKNGEQS